MHNAGMINDYNSAGVRVGIKGLFVIKTSLYSFCDINYIFWCKNHMGNVTRGVEVLNYTCILRTSEAHMGLMT